MKILAVSSFLHPRGGDVTCLLAMCRAAMARGHEVVPFGMRHPDNLPSTWETRFPPQLDVWSARGLARVAKVAQAVWSPDAARAIDTLVADVKPDVAHVHHLHRHLTPSVLGPLRRRGVRVVWTVHDYELVCPAGTLWSRGAPCDACRGHHYAEAVRRRCKRDDPLHSAAVAVEKWVHARLDVWSRVDAFCAPSAYLAERLVHFGVPADRVHHVPNLVEPAPAGGPPGDAVLFAGRLSAEKGVEDVLAMARRLPHRPFRLAGGGPLRDVLARRAPPNVTWLGPLDPAEVAEELRAAGVVVVPSRWPENDPYAVLEAQLAGRAVVASRVGGIPEQIDDGVDGVLVPPGDVAALTRAVEGLLADPARATLIGSRARTRVIRERAPERWMDTVEAVWSGDR